MVKVLTPNRLKSAWRITAAFSFFGDSPDFAQKTDQIFGSCRQPEIAVGKLDIPGIARRIKYFYLYRLISVMGFRLADVYGASKWISYQFGSNT